MKIFRKGNLETIINHNSSYDEDFLKAKGWKMKKNFYELYDLPASDFDDRSKDVLPLCDDDLMAEEILNKRSAKLDKQRQQLAEDAKKLAEERKALAEEAKQFAEERARVEAEKARLDAIKKELHDQKYEQSDLAQMLEMPPPTH